MSERRFQGHRDVRVTRAWMTPEPERRATSTSPQNAQSLPPPPTLSRQNQNPDPHDEQRNRRGTLLTRLFRRRTNTNSTANNASASAASSSTTVTARSSASQSPSASSLPPLSPSAVAPAAAANLSSASSSSSSLSSLGANRGQPPQHDAQHIRARFHHHPPHHHHHDDDDDHHHHHLQHHRLGLEGLEDLNGHHRHHAPLPPRSLLLDVVIGPDGPVVQPHVPRRGSTGAGIGHRHRSSGTNEPPPPPPPPPPQQQQPLPRRSLFGRLLGRRQQQPPSGSPPHAPQQQQGDAASRPRSGFLRHRRSQPPPPPPPQRSSRMSGGGYLRRRRLRSASGAGGGGGSGPSPPMASLLGGPGGLGLGLGLGLDAEGAAPLMMMMAAGASLGTSGSNGGRGETGQGAADILSRLREEIIEAIAFAVMDQQEIDAAQAELSRLERARNVDKLRQAFEALRSEYHAAVKTNLAIVAGTSSGTNASEGVVDAAAHTHVVGAVHVVGAAAHKPLTDVVDDDAARAHDVADAAAYTHDPLTSAMADELRRQFSKEVATEIAELEARLVTVRLLYNVSLIGLLIAAARDLSGATSGRVQRLEACLATHCDLMARNSDDSVVVASLAAQEWLRAANQHQHGQGLDSGRDRQDGDLSDPTWGSHVIPNFDAVRSTLRDPAVAAAVDVDTLLGSSTQLGYRIKHQRFQLSCLKNRNPGKVDIAIRRNTITQDSRDVLGANTPAQMKRRLLVQFVGEEGKDLGGLSRDWLGSLGHQLVTRLTEAGFARIRNGCIEMISALACPQDQLDDFFMLGQVIGLGLFHGKLVNVFFFKAVYLHVLGKTVTLEDVKQIDAEFVAGLQYLLDNPGADQLELDFTVHVDAGHGPGASHELVPGGRDVVVTDSNKHEYVEAMVQWKYGVGGGIGPQLHAFSRGLSQFVTRAQLSPFEADELELLSCGLADIDVDDWKRNTKYDNGYTETSQPVRLFWKAVEGFSPTVKAKVLQFVTGASRLPINGFAGLQGSHGRTLFCICRSGGVEDGRLPVGHTCVNQLDLPEYGSMETLVAKLLQAVDETEGFGLV